VGDCALQLLLGDAHEAAQRLRGRGHLGALAVAGKLDFAKEDNSSHHLEDLLLFLGREPDKIQAFHHVLEPGVIVHAAHLVRAAWASPGFMVRAGHGEKRAAGGLVALRTLLEVLVIAGTASHAELLGFPARKELVKDVKVAFAFALFGQEGSERGERAKPRASEEGGRGMGRAGFWRLHPPAQPGG
jgi:hypothetical protein